jgi:hypothetical protein
MPPVPVLVDEPDDDVPLVPLVPVVDDVPLVDAPSVVLPVLNDVVVDPPVAPEPAVVLIPPVPVS